MLENKVTRLSREIFLNEILRTNGQKASQSRYERIWGDEER